MGWVKLDDAVGEHPKIVGLSDSAFALWVSGLAYCNRNLTDGLIPTAVGHGQLRYCDGNPTPAIRELERGGLWERVENGWHVHDYEDYQPTRRQVLADREATRQRVVKHRSGGGNEVTEEDARNGVTTPDVPGTGRGSGLDVVEGGSGGEPFEQFWAFYPRKVGKRAARAAFEKALKRAPADEIIAGAERYAFDPNREQQFTAHPTTWLNRDSWGDDPLPSRNGQAPRLADRLMQSAMEGGESDEPAAGQGPRRQAPRGLPRP